MIAETKKLDLQETEVALSAELAYFDQTLFDINDEFSLQITSLL
jgi:hypothetical protein